VHTLRMTILGFVVLTIFFLGARLLNRSKGGKPVDGAWIFIWVWLVAAVINLLVGVFAAGIPLVVEIPVLAVVFGLPALVAWYLSRNYGPRLTS
jgi:hypothetical protein